MGVHHSKVRSLHLDTECWDRGQLDLMLAMGNVKCREKYEASTPCWYLRPSADQDSAIVRENWIRAKYERKEFLADAKEPLSISPMPERPREGFLYKANKSKVWQKRYFMLHGRHLCYYKTPGDSYPKGVIDICELSFKLPHAPDQNKRFVFEASTSKRTYPIAAETAAEMLDWVHTLKRSAAYYITLLNSGQLADVPGAGQRAGEEKAVLPLTFNQMGTALKQGVLSKVGGRWQSWNKRLCVLTERTLFYFKKEKPAASDLSEGGIPLGDCFVSSGDVKAGKPFCVSLATAARIYFLCASTDVEKQEWQAALAAQCDKLNPQRLVDFGQMDQPSPIRGNSDPLDDDSD